MNTARVAGLAAVALWLAGTGVALSQTADAITDPAWAKQPTGLMRSQVYPRSAMENEKVGAAVVRCTAEADGSLGGCALACETPKGWGFGPAALKLVKSYRLAAEQPDGRPIAGRTVALPFYFNPPFLPRAQCDGAAGAAP